MPNWANMLTWWQWGLLAAIPPAIVALYFLKLRREPVVVASTFLWHRSLEDLHVNSLWQRLRRSLLLLLQLIVVGLAMLALLRPYWRGTEQAEDRSIFLVDTSASMSATDLGTSRLEEAKRRVLALIDQMEGGDVAMIVSFSDRPRVEQSFTDNRSQLRRKLEQIEPTERGSSIFEALRQASGLANPGRTATEAGDVEVADALPATLYILSDGNFGDVEGFSLGNLDPRFIPIGAVAAPNVGIVAFSAERGENELGELEAFGRVQNFGADDVTVQVSLYLDDELIDARDVDVAAEASSGVAFPLGELDVGLLEMRIDSDDEFSLDDRAWAAVNPPRRSRVLVVTPGNELLLLALRTPGAAEISTLRIEEPSYLRTAEYQRQAAAGDFDLVIFDRCRPESEDEESPAVMPRSNTMSIGVVPVADGWRAAEDVELPQIVDSERAHPMMHMVDLSDVDIAESMQFDAPTSATTLVEGHLGPLVAIAPREGFEDVVIGFSLVSAEGPVTNWPARLSFPVFMMNTLNYLGGRRSVAEANVIQPGDVVPIKTELPLESIRVRTPDEEIVNLRRGVQNTFHFGKTDRLGSYAVLDESGELERFAVNLFDERESAIAPRAEEAIRIGHVKVEAQTAQDPTRYEAWKLLLLLALGVLLFEWYIYNRRVYL